MSTMEKNIRDFLATGADWEKYDTQLPGVSIVKMAGTKTRPPLLAVEINPVKDGKPMKRKGLFVTSEEMLLEFADLLTSAELPTLMKTIDSINQDVLPKEKSRKPLKLE